MKWNMNAELLKGWTSCCLPACCWYLLLCLFYFFENEYMFMLYVVDWVWSYRRQWGYFSQDEWKVKFRRKRILCLPTIALSLSTEQTPDNVLNSSKARSIRYYDNVAPICQISWLESEWVQKHTLKTFEQLLCTITSIKFIWSQLHRYDIRVSGTQLLIRKFTHAHIIDRIPYLAPSPRLSVSRLRRNGSLPWQI